MVLLRIAEAVAVIGSLAAIGYYGLSIWSALKYLHSRQPLSARC